MFSLNDCDNRYGPFKWPLRMLLIAIAVRTVLALLGVK